MRHFDNFNSNRKLDLFGIGTMVSGALGLGGSIANAKLNYKLGQQQIEAQREENSLARQHDQYMLDLQYQKNLEQWNRENEYNSPLATMSRYAAAGLNKNLVYGQSNNAANSPTYGFSPAKPANIAQNKVDLSTAINALMAMGEGVDKILKAQSDSKLMDINVDMQRELLNQLKLKGNLMADEKYGIRAQAQTLSEMNDQKLQSMMFNNELNGMRRHLMSMEMSKREEALKRYMNEFVPSKSQQEDKYLHRGSLGKVLNSIYNGLQSRFPLLPESEIVNNILDFFGEVLGEKFF